MSYGDNLVTNGQATDGLNSWTSSGVTIKSKIYSDGNYFELDTTAFMEQHIDVITIDANPKEFVVAVDFFYDAILARNLNKVKAFLSLKLTFQTGIVDYSIYPLFESNDLRSTFIDTWFTVQNKCVVRGGEVLTGIDLKIYTTGAPCKIGIDNISIRKVITEIEEHNNNTHCHNLPLNITVGEHGIIGMQGEKVAFHLGDLETGAIFGGTLTVDSNGIFGGTVFAENIDTSNAKIAAAQIETLEVGNNVIMGPNAFISWDNINNRPDIPTLPGYLKSTYIDSTIIQSPTIIGGSLTAGNASKIKLFDAGGGFGTIQFLNALNAQLGRIWYEATQSVLHFDCDMGQMVIESESGIDLMHRSSGNSISIGMHGIDLEGTSLRFNNDEIATKQWVDNNYPTKWFVDDYYSPRTHAHGNDYVKSYTGQNLSLVATEAGIVVRVNGVTLGSIFYD